LIIGTALVWGCRNRFLGKITRLRCAFAGARLPLESASMRYSISKSFVSRREAAGSADACPNASSDALGGQGEATTTRMIWKWNHTLLALILNTALFAGCGTAVVNPVTGQAERSVMSEEAEIAEGAKAHQQVLQEYGVVSDPILQAYVNNLGQRLAKLSHRNQLQWHFTLPPTGAIRSCRPMAWVPSTWRAAPTTRAT
jgi:hypothetical protein